MLKSVSEIQTCTAGSIITHYQSGYIGTECLANGFEQGVIDVLRLHNPLYCKSKEFELSRMYKDEGCEVW